MTETKLHELDGEQLRTFPAIARMLPAARGHGCADQSSIYRWALRGVRVGGRRVTLEWVKIGATRYSSVEAIQRFLAKLNGPAAARPNLPESCRTPEQRKRDADRAEQRAARAGRKL
jgi:hypothetical protein